MMLKGSLLERLNQLSNREIYVLKAYYLWEHSLKEIGNYFDVTRERIRQIRIKAERRLFGHCLGNKGDTTYQEDIDELKREIAKVLIFEGK